MVGERRAGDRRVGDRRGDGEPSAVSNDFGEAGWDRVRLAVWRRDCRDACDDCDAASAAALGVRIGLRLDLRNDGVGPEVSVAADAADRGLAVLGMAASAAMAPGRSVTTRGSPRAVCRTWNTFGCAASMSTHWACLILATRCSLLCRTPLGSFATASTSMRRTAASCDCPHDITTRVSPDCRDASDWGVVVAGERSSGVTRVSGTTLVTSSSSGWSKVSTCVRGRGAAARAPAADSESLPSEPARSRDVSTPDAPLCSLTAGATGVAALGVGAGD